MDPVSFNSIPQRVLRFSGVQPQVLDQLETKRLQEDAKSLFGENLDVFVKRDESSNVGTVDFIAKSPSQTPAKSPLYGSGFLRNLHRALTGQDIQPTEVPHQLSAEHSGDFFERSVESPN